MGFSRQEYWGGLPFPSPGDLPNTETDHASPVSPALTDGFFTNAPHGKPYIYTSVCKIDPGEGRPGSQETKSTPLVLEAHREAPR